MSTMGGGAVAGSQATKRGPWKSLDAKKENEKEKKTSRLKKENIDLSIVDEVLALIMERGILR